MRQVTGTPQPLGMEKRNDTINFSIVVPAGKKCELLLYKAGEAEPVKVFDMPQEDAVGEVRFLALDELDSEICEYSYRIEGRMLLDPYAKSVSRTKAFGVSPDPQMHEIRARITEDEYDWEDEKNPCIPYNEVIAYSLHVRGFTMHPSSGVKHKGTFRGIIEKLDYIKALGVNQIQCMPVYEFNEMAGKKINYWGYGDGYYFAPKASYSSSDDACRELKDMVKACHKEGIEVVLEMPFDGGILPQTALTCLQYYRMEYHVDGFVINPYTVPWEMLINDPFLKGIKLLKKNDWFQNTMRRFLKSDAGMLYEVTEALRHHTGVDGEYNYITTHTGFTMNDLVSYNEKHNESNGEKNQDGPEQNYSWNCGEEGPSRKRAVTELRKKQIRNAFAMLLLAQGTPCILAGDEFRNTQIGNNNVYCQDNEIAWLDWRNLKTHEELFHYVKKLIALRKTHFSLHKETVLTGEDKKKIGYPDISYHGEYAWQMPGGDANRQLGIMYCDAKDNMQDICYVAYNAHWDEKEFALPTINGKTWFKIFDTAQEKPETGTAEEKRTIKVSGRSIVMLAAK